MFWTVFISVLVTLYVLVCVGLYTVYYLVVDILDLPVIGQSPCTAHAALKQLIEKLVKEAVNLPLLSKAHAYPATSEENTRNRSYEDLLATAIINKVITSSQNNIPPPSPKSVSSRISTSSRNRENKEYYFGEETLDTKWRTTDLDTTSISSLEDCLQSECSFGSRKYVDKVTLTIKQDIEEVDNFDSENEDDAEYFRSSSSLLNDSESNWFLQKRQFKGSHSPVPVPMLVPNPATEAKVLIGDKPLDDTSDLSDVGSDYEESIQPHTTHSLLVQSKNIIGGARNSFEIGETADVRSESSTDSGVKEVNGKEQKSFDIPEPSKTDISLDDDNVEDSSFISIYSNTEKEAEYTERYASLPRQILKTSKNSYVEANGKGETHEKCSDFEFIGGNYSKKEKERWKNPVEMKNNPYSKESIERRIERSNSAAGSIFGPDYYARLAGKPSGGKLLSSEINGVTWPPPVHPRSRTQSPTPELPKVAPPPREQIVIDSSLSSEPFIINSDVPPKPPNTKPPPIELVETNGIHQALKAIVTPVEENMPDTYFDSNINKTSPERISEVHKLENYTVPAHTSEVTSDSDISFINFYDVEHSQVVKKSRNEDIHIPIKSTPLPVAHESSPIGTERNENIANEYDELMKYHKEVIKEAPVAKPRVLSVQAKKDNAFHNKSPPIIKEQNVSSSNAPNLKRNLSDASLIDGSFDNHPKVLHQKKDNTLISKIYKDPKVRLFALHSREEIPGQEGEFIPAFQTQRSVDHKIALSDNSSLYLSKGRSYNSSDDGITSEYESGKTGKMSFFSSEEDLLSLNSESSFKHTDVANKNVKLSESLYTEHGKTDRFKTPSPSATATSTRRFIYGSQEDLLSIDETSSIPKRKDNTLISKIYKDPNVRNFALKTHKDIMPDSELAMSILPKPRKKSSSDDERYRTESVRRYNFQNRLIYSSYDDLLSAEFSQDVHQHKVHVVPTSYSISPDYVEDGYKSEDLDIDKVAKRHVVRKALGKFVKSEVNMESEFQRSTSLEADENIRVSVRDLKKKFEDNDARGKPLVSSLTARSLSKQVKDSLKE